MDPWVGAAPATAVGRRSNPVERASGENLVGEPRQIEADLTRARHRNGTTLDRAQVGRGGPAADV